MITKGDAKLVAYAQGILNQDDCAEVERRLAESPELQAELASIEKALSLAETSAQPSDRLRQLVLGSIEPATRFEGFVDRLTALLDLDPDRVRELLAAIDAVPQTPWVAGKLPGAHLLHFDGGARVAQADCGLIYLEPGVLYPAHRHLGDEWTLILRGCVDENGDHLYRPGDIIFKTVDSVHSFRIVGDEPCVFAVVLHQGVEWIS